MRCNQPNSNSHSPLCGNSKYAIKPFCVNGRCDSSALNTKLLSLARDVPRLWHAPSTQAKDRKRMLRLLIKDITVNKLVEQRQLSVHIRWQGGACTDLFVQIPPSAAGRNRYRSPIVDRIRDL